MRVLIAPDKFKGSLSARNVCEAIADGLRETDKTFEIQMHPMADGGDGSLEVIGQHLNFSMQEVNTFDPLGRPISSFYFTSSKIAFIEIAKASGLVLLKEEERNPLLTSTYGTGIMVKDAIKKGFTEIFLFLGGSATNDGGMGIAAALGIHFYNTENQLLKPIGDNLAKVSSISNTNKLNLEQINFTLLCDVDNPLYGENGAAYVYAPQKGADADVVEQLNQGLRHFSNLLFKYSEIEVAKMPGLGAAGGIGAAMVSIFNAQIKSGIDSFAKLTNLEDEIQKADLVISGEGRLDRQSFQGKVIKGVSDLCIKFKKPLLLFVGKNDLLKEEEKELGVRQIFSISEVADSQDDAMQNASKYLKQMANSL